MPEEPVQERRTVNLGSDRLWVRRTRQAAGLRANEAALQTLASEGRKEEFFAQILPLLRSLKAYIERRLRVAYLNMDFSTPVYTSEDILDETVLRAWSEYGHKPKDLDLEEWLYRIANGILQRYLRERHAIDQRRRSLEGLSRAELRTLQEQPITADAEGEIYLAEDLDDSELPPREFTAPAEASNPEEELEKKEELEQLFRALSKIPVKERIVFELSAVEGFPDEAVARVANVSPETVPRILQKVRSEVLRELQAQLKQSDAIPTEGNVKKSA